MEAPMRVFVAGATGALLLAEVGITFDRWVVLNAVVTGSVPAEGEVLHERLRAALDDLRADLSAGIPRRDRETAGRVLVEITRQAGAWLDSDRGVRFGK
jgi:hypothetical protein